ncbi:MAG: Na/Pi symporter [Verrucomicrobia bacterium]|nr:Na/Pi symporter [Verrucomicrobiota bacterium]
MVQSSSATTVAIIGFVSAGLVTFPQAIGVVFGASLGTTGTGWIIAVLGLKISVGYYALPLVGIGAFMKLLGRGRYRALGEAVAGFGLIFIGIENMQDGMRGLSAVFDLSVLPASGLTGHLLAMLLGIALTVLMQSSSAAIATTLTALHTGAINFEQAASLVIGAAVGTTITGVLAAIGGSTSAKRTACAHVTFNLSTGIIAILILPVFLRLIFWAQEHLGLEAVP